MQPDGAWQGQKVKRTFECDAFRRPALRQTCAVGLRLRLGRLAALDVRPEPSRPQRDGVAVGILTQNLAIGTAAILTT